MIRLFIPILFVTQLSLGIFSDNPEELNLYKKIKETRKQNNSFEVHRMCKKFLKNFRESIRSAEINYLLGETEDDFFKSIFYLRQNTKNFPKSYWALMAQMSIALKYYTIGNYSKAEKEFKVFIDTYGNSTETPKAIYFRSISLYLVGRYKEAEKEVEILNNKYEKSPWTKKSLLENGKIKFALKKFPEAIELFQKVLLTEKTTSFKPYIIYKIGESFIAMNNKDKAIKYFKELINNFPENKYAIKIARTYNLQSE